LPKNAECIQHGPATWSLADWNAALFDHFFRATDDDAGPVNRIVVTGDELRAAAHAEGAKSHEVHEWFRRAVRQRLSVSGRSLCNDAMELEWRIGEERIRKVPPYFAHLLVTCVAAAGTSSSKRPQGEFRQRLNEFLGRGEGNSSYNLAGLRQLWEMLRTWLDKAARRGEPYRRIVLPDPGYLRIIGYSLKLAFPTSKDQARLIDLFDPCGYPADPPVVPLLMRIEGSFSRFSVRFREACAEFRSAYFNGKQDLYAKPFWSAVRDAVRAVRDKSIVARRMDRGAAALRLDVDSIDQGSDRRFILSLLVDRDVACPRELRTIEVPGCEAAGCGRLVVPSNEGDLLAVGTFVLSGQLGKKFPSIDSKDLARTVSQGVLLFSQNEEGVWLANLSCPASGPVKALLRRDLADRFVNAVRRSTSNIVKYPSLYEGWHEVEGFDGEHIIAARFDKSPLKDITCLMDTIRSPRLGFLGGVRVDGGFLGRRCALPQVISDLRSVSLRIHKAIPNEGANGTVRLIPDESSTTRFHFPDAPALPHDLDGTFVVEMARGDELLASRRFEARVNILDCNYLAPTSPSTWFTEGGLRSTNDLSDGTRPFLGVATELVKGDHLQTVSVVANSSRSDFVTSGPAAELTEILAAVSLRKRGIPESELLGWIRAVFNLDGAEMFETARAWAEAGLFEVCAFRRWRMRAYFAVRPRLICFKDSRGAVRATVSGLIPSGLYRQMQDMVTSRRVTLSVSQQMLPRLPNIVQLEAESIDDVLELSEQLGLPAPTRLLPLHSIVCSVAELMTFPEPLIQNHRLQGYWNGNSGRFEQAGTDETPCLKWFRRDDAPDAFAVSFNQRDVFESRSETWGRLVMAHLKGESPFTRGETSTVVRSKPDRSYLPMPLARWAALTSGTSPGPYPSLTGGIDYTYAFPSYDERNRAFHLLWPTALPESIVRQVSWIAKVSRHIRGEKCVIVPPQVRAALASVEHLPASTGLGELRRIPPRWLARLVAVANRCPADSLRPGERR
jgi:hypothetical protein